MTLRRPTRRRRASITSLIDVIFLLLLFFMLASTFSRFSEVEVAAAASASSAPTPVDQRIVRVVVEPGRLVIDGVPGPDVELARVLAGMDAEASVAVSVSDDVTTQRLVDVLSAIARASAVTVVLTETA